MANGRSLKRIKDKMCLEQRASETLARARAADPVANIDMRRCDGCGHHRHYGRQCPREWCECRRGALLHPADPPIPTDDDGAPLCWAHSGNKRCHLRDGHTSPHEWETT